MSGELGWDWWLVSDDYVTVLSSLLSILEREPINTTKYEKKKSVAFVYTGEKKQPVKPYKTTGHTVWFHLYEILEPAKLSLGGKNHQNNEYL